MNTYELIKKDTGEIIYTGNYADFKSCLEDAIRKKIPLHNIDLRNKNLINANLDDGMFGAADFSGTNLSGANLSESYCKNANFSNASLFNTCLAYSNLSQCQFSGASFGATDITGCIIDRSNFSTLSAFTLNFAKTRQMHDCSFTTAHGLVTPITEPPIVINGLQATPIIITKTHILNGHNPLRTSPSLNTLKRLTARKLHKQLGALNDDKYGKIN